MPQDATALRITLSLAPVIPVIILDDVSKARPLAEALVAGGLPVLEVTLRTPHALQVIEEMAKVAGAVVGSGTVRSPLQMGHSVDAGATFMVSPGASPRLLEAADDFSIPLLPGIGTPTEAMTASEHGYTFLKFFPAEALGGAGTRIVQLPYYLPDWNTVSKAGNEPNFQKVLLGKLGAKSFLDGLAEQLNSAQADWKAHH